MDFNELAPYDEILYILHSVEAKRCPETGEKVKVKVITVKVNINLRFMLLLYSVILQIYSL